MGKLIPCPENCPLAPSGYVYDAETELYYLQSRYYNPEVGRFINADILVSTGQGLLGNNMFAYCQNNPACRKDIAGAEDIEVVDLDGNLSIDEEDIVGGGPCGTGDSIQVGPGGQSPSGGQSGGNASSANSINTYYPPNNGFQGQTREITLEAGTIIQRTGPTTGRYVAPAGTPQNTLSLPFNQLGQPTATYMVTQSFTVTAGTAAPWFNSIGGGTQYLLKCSLQHLIDNYMVCLYKG